MGERGSEGAREELEEDKRVTAFFLFILGRSPFLKEEVERRREGKQTGDKDVTCLCLLTIDLEVDQLESSRRPGRRIRPSVHPVHPSILSSASQEACGLPNISEETRGGCERLR